MLRLGRMKSFHIHPSDIHWLKRWLTGHAVFLLLAGSLWAAVQYWPTPARGVAQSLVDDQTLVAAPGDAPADFGSKQAPPSFETDDQGFAVPPEGWRRTKDGWEHVSTWRPVPRPLGEIVLEQEKREPAWMKSALAGVRGIPPLAFGLFQMTAIAVVVNLTKRRAEVVRLDEANTAPWSK